MGFLFEEFARAFLEIAVRDLENARRAFEIGDYPECVFHCQQAVEKAVKAMLELRKRFVFNHGPELLAKFEEAFRDEWRDEFNVIVEA